MLFATYLKKKIEDMELLQYKVDQEVGIGKSPFSKLLRDRRSIKEREKVALCRVLNVPEELVELRDDNKYYYIGA